MRRRETVKVRYVYFIYGTVLYVCMSVVGLGNEGLISLPLDLRKMNSFPFESAENLHIFLNYHVE